MTFILRKKYKKFGYLARLRPAQKPIGWYESDHFPK